MARVTPFLASIASLELKRVTLIIKDYHRGTERDWMACIDWEEIGRLFDTPQFSNVERLWVHWHLRGNLSPSRSKVKKFLENGPIRQLRHRAILKYRIENLEE